MQMNANSPLLCLLYLASSIGSASANKGAPVSPANGIWGPKDLNSRSGQGHQPR